MMDLERINRLVATEVMEWNQKRLAPHTSNPVYYCDHSGVAHMTTREWNPTHNIAQAWMVVEKVQDGRVIIESFPGGWFCKFRRWDGVILVYAEAETVQIAICVAALKSIGVKVEG